MNYQTPKKIRITVDRCLAHPDDGHTCHVHSEGDTYEFDFERCPQDFCAAAFHSLWPALRVMELGGRHPWDKDANVTFVACPDPLATVNFKIETIDESGAEGGDDGHGAGHDTGQEAGRGA